MKNLPLKDYLYELPDEQIALHPLERRDQSKLLFSNKGNISHHTFADIQNLIPPKATLFFNDTKVIPARLHFKKETGATIEIFLLAPIEPSTLMVQAMAAKNECTWHCMIGNLKRWPTNTMLTLHLPETNLNATLVDSKEGRVNFIWSGDFTFAEILTLSGKIPLPPYIHREVEENDKDRYQTVYSHHEGAVAAPTAGLHFTNLILEKLKDKGINHDFFTLHVSAGTFQPIKVDDAAEHTMHNEQVIVSLQNLDNIIASEFVIPVGTTSMRTLESLYWYGVKLLQNSKCEFNITQHDPYLPHESLPEKRDALNAVKNFMVRNKLSTITGNTSIYIMPGYTFRICQGLITNFHQPGSTLILLVAAFVGQHWRSIYKSALENDYRFLSYGDSSFLIP